jgi:hypothetical protein
MTARRPCPPAPGPGPLEEYAARFDDLFFSLAQRRGAREYPTGLLAPRERNRTIACLAGAEPVAGAGMPGVQRLQFFLSESVWEAERVNDRRLELLREQAATAPHDGGVIVIDDSGDRKDGTATADVGRVDRGSATMAVEPLPVSVEDPLHERVEVAAQALDLLLDSEGLLHAPARCRLLPAPYVQRAVQVGTDVQAHRVALAAGRA